MSNRFTRGDSAAEPKRLHSRDLAIVIFAVAAIVLGNVGVVRALDIALDAIHR